LALNDRNIGMYLPAHGALNPSFRTVTRLSALIVIFIIIVTPISAERALALFAGISRL